MYKFLSLLFVLTTSVVVAQPIQYERVFYQANYNGAQQYSTAPVKGANHFLCAGYAANRKGFVYEIDSAGNMLWNKTYGYSNVFPSVAFWAMIPTSDTAFVAAGDVNDTASARTSTVLVKMKPNGDTVWCRLIEHSNVNLYPLALSQTHDSGFVICGYGYQSTTPYNQMYVARTDKRGNLIWSKLLYSGNSDEYAYSVRETSDSGYIVAGVTSAGNRGCLIKMGQSGTVTWANTYTENNSGVYLSDALQLTSGYFFLGTGPGGYICARVDVNGNVLNAMSYAGSGLSIMNLPESKLRKLNANRLYTVFGTCGGSTFLITDTLGNNVSNNLLNINAGDVYHTSDGGYLIAGNGPMCAIKSAANITWEHLGLIKTDSTGSSGGSCTVPGNPSPNSVSLAASPVSFTVSTGCSSRFIPLKIGSILLTDQPGCVSWTGDVENFNTRDMKVFPQPASELIRVELQGAKRFEIYDVTGVLLQIVDHAANSEVIDVSGLAPGVYMLQSVTTNGHFARKILITR